MGQRQLQVAVIGAGAMGGWTAYQLQRRGAAVTLLDPWGPGHSRASSGGETRIIRSVYGPHRRYVEMAAEAFRAWRAFEARWQVDCYTRTGALWLFSLDDERYLRASLPFLRAFDLPIRQLDLKTLGHRFPQIGLEGVRSAWMEEEATRAIILDRRARDMGFAWYQEPNGKIWWTLVMGAGTGGEPTS